ncbi:Alpha/Beta hydrolase protein [Colletotrichum acutatum]|uniref:Alpha/Beta hydrolase protein n=1 Tax=Glomerella acutata TaxID=27357 RepID=A0AAD8U8P2_GLOAC|nr:Alpha/Beta hydrolase protein [Colletotrichum acutatum]KAK1701858.1 Alpha/Beta hydrolase protein [Colletotrichum acutatum]
MAIRSLALGWLAISSLQISAQALDFRSNCDEACEAAYRSSLAIETKDWVNVDVNVDPFYANPSNLSDYAVGDLVKWQDLTGTQAAKIWTVPAGMSLSRFFYMSEDIDGKPLPLPHSPCSHAPFILAQAGYAVIAPDYAGQGSDISQGFMYESGALHAADVSHSLQAARKALGERLSKEWVVVGHSEGGLTAWRTNEREAKAGKATGGFIGDVVSVYFLQSLSKLLKSIRIEDYVSDIVASRIPLSNQGCLKTGGTIYGSLTETQLYKNTSWLTQPRSPMLVVQGTKDILTYAETMEQDFDATCKAFPESPAELLLYPELGHDQAFQASHVDYLAWVADRFNNVSVSSGCSKRTIEPATNHPSLIHQTWQGSPQ